MKNLIPVFKPVGYTPLEIISILKKQKEELREAKIGYAGRLDPMAEGVLILLINEENKKKHFYERLEKEYEFEILFGISTDTYDVMGIPISSIKGVPIDIKRIQTLINGFIGTHNQPYPPYSSARVKGRPLYYWARRNKLSDITIPTHTIHISQFEIKKILSITSKALHRLIRERLNMVKGDFRQEEIMKQWNDILIEQHTFPVITCKITCSSGTYVRSIAHRLGSQMETKSLALSIKRTRVGTYDLSTALRIV